MKYASMLISDLFAHCGIRLMDCVPQILELLITNINNEAVLNSTRAHLLTAIVDVMRAYRSCDRSVIQSTFPLGAVFPIFQAVTKNLSDIISTDYESAVLISEALLEGFSEIVLHYASESEFMMINTVPYFRYVPILVWRHHMITQRTVEGFLRLMNGVIRAVGQKMHVELHKPEIEDFIDFCCAPECPYPDSVDYAATRIRPLYKPV